MNIVRIHTAEPDPEPVTLISGDILIKVNDPPSRAHQVIIGFDSGQSRAMEIESGFVYSDSIAYWQDKVRSGEWRKLIPGESLTLEVTE